MSTNRTSARLVAAGAAVLTEGPAVDLVVALQRALAAGAAQREPACRALEEAIRAAHEAHGAAAIRIDPDEELLFFDERLVASRRHARSIRSALGRLRARGIAEVRFARALSFAEVVTFVDLVHRSAAGLEPVAACRKIVEGLWTTRLRGTVDLISLEQFGHAARVIKVDPAAYARLVYARLLTLQAELLARGGDKELRRHFAWRLGRAVQSLISAAGTHERELLGLVQLRGVETFAVKHPVNTGVLAVLLGRRLGLPRDLLWQVGLAGLLCWSGKSKVPPAVLNKPAPARTPDEAREYGRHPYRALGALFELRRFEEPLLLAALVAAEFEARPGCPPRRQPLQELHPLAQLVGLCDQLDGRLGAGPPDAPPKDPAAVLDAIARDARGRFDPTLVQLLGNLLQAPAAPRSA